MKIRFPFITRKLLLQRIIFLQFRRQGISSFINLGLISLAVLTLVFLIPIKNLYTAEVTLIWDQNLEDDLGGYKLYYGNASRNYHSSVDVGKNTSFTISDLVSDKTFFIAVTAYDIFGNESDFSEEVIFNVPFDNSSTTPAPTPFPANLILSTNSAGKSVSINIVDVSVFDQEGNPMSDIIVKASANGRGVFVDPDSAKTDANGKAEFGFRFKLFAKDGQILFSAGNSSATLTQTR